METQPENIVSTIDPPLPQSSDAARANCRKLEEGGILFFEKTPFDFPAEDLNFLLAQRQSDARYHKNIAYRPQQDIVTGAASRSGEQPTRLLSVMRTYSANVSKFVSKLLAPYRWQLDYASFRPFQEEGRTIRTRARNDLLHVDNFPTRPTNGNRILRFFTNINPSEPRRWITTEPFEALVRQMGGSSELPYPHSLTGWRRGRHSVLRALRSAGLPIAARSPYDEFMLRMHHAMKEDESFQADCPKIPLEFPPGSCWTVFTDLVPHAALSGQYLLEQTFIIERDSMIDPEQSPLRILESVSGQAPLVGQPA